MVSEYKSSSEQRSNERFPLRSPWPILVHFGGANLNASLVDISEDGMKLSISKFTMGTAIQKGFDATLALSLSVSPPSGNKALVKAAVRWIQRFPVEYVLGMQFIDPVGEKLLLELEAK